MTSEEVRDRVRALLLEEVKGNPLPRWFYLTATTGGDSKFAASMVLSARGPTEAWNLFHMLYTVPKDCDITCIPVPDELAARVPPDLVWRVLGWEDTRRLW